MNRAERRKLPRAIQPIADNLHTIRCPDCDNDTSLIESGGAFIVQLLHDDTCPWLKRYEASR